MAKEKTYVVHFCKNSKKPEFIPDPSGKMTSHKDKKTGKMIKKPKMIENPEYCNNAWIDVDVTHVQDYPPTWKYCESCVAKGYENPKTKKKMPQERIEAFKKVVKRYKKEKQH